MFRMRDSQESLWQSQFLVTPKKAKRLEGSWAEIFRNQALPLIDEERFAPMYCADNGRPNRAVQTVLGVHILKEMFNLTDQEALEQLEFNLLWHHALGLDMEETHLPQKTLHNFRVRPQARRPGAVTQAVYFANMALLDRRAGQMGLPGLAFRTWRSCGRAGGTAAPWWRGTPEVSPPSGWNEAYEPAILWGGGRADCPGLPSNSQHGGLGSRVFHQFRHK